VIEAVNPGDIELLAAKEHEQFAGSTVAMFRAIRVSLAGQPAVLRAFGDLTCVQSWSKRFGTLYEFLTEKEKEAYRSTVRQKLSCYRPWLNAACVLPQSDKIPLAMEYGETLTATAKGPHAKADLVVEFARGVFGDGYANEIDWSREFLQKEPWFDWLADDEEEE
jgi:hypothetical protein